MKPAGGGWSRQEADEAGRSELNEMSINDVSSCRSLSRLTDQTMKNDTSDTFNLHSSSSENHSDYLTTQFTLQSVVDLVYRHPSLLRLSRTAISCTIWHRPFQNLCDWTIARQRHDSPVNENMDDDSDDVDSEVKLAAFPYALHQQQQQKIWQHVREPTLPGYETADRPVPT